MLIQTSGFQHIDATTRKMSINSYERAIKDSFRDLLGDEIVDKYPFATKEDLGIPANKAVRADTIDKHDIYLRKVAFGADEDRRTFIALIYAPRNDLIYSSAKVELIIQEKAGENDSFVATEDGPFKGAMDAEKFKALKELINGTSSKKQEYMLF